MVINDVKEHCKMTIHKQLEEALHIWLLLIWLLQTTLTDLIRNLSSKQNIEKWQKVKGCSKLCRLHSCQSFKIKVSVNKFLRIIKWIFKNNLV